jgi:hypothetical protein
VLCRFIAARGIGTPLNEDMVRLVHAVTGWSLSLEELEKIGERIYTLERLINVRRGVSRKDNILPFRVLNDPIADGPVKGRFCPPKDLDAMLDTYYELRGWTPEGIPTEGNLRCFRKTSRGSFVPHSGGSRIGVRDKRRNPVCPKSVKGCPDRGTKNPVSAKEKQGSDSLRAMADPLLKKVLCLAPGQPLGIVRPKALPRETFL